jgi:hypothetical protein
MSDNHVTLNPNSPTLEKSRVERRELVTETTETLVRTMESILEEREASQAKEKEAVESLNVVLQRMGYQIVPLHQDPRRRQKRGRAAEAAHPVAGADPQGETVPRRRGRPAKVKAPDEELAS